MTLTTPHKPRSTRLLSGQTTLDLESGKRRVKGSVNWRLVLPLAVAAAAFPVAVSSARSHATARYSVQAKIRYCEDCHGTSAQGYRGYYAIPRLAGQLYPYVVKALSNFPKERGQNPAIHGTSFIMLPVAHSLNRSQIKAVAAYVSSLR